MYPGEQIAGYALVRPLGAGGMKQVWRAKHLESGREVALALVHSFNPVAFTNEVTLARRIKSPHVAEVIDGFVSEHGVGVVVSELCNGLDLMHYRQARPVTAAEAVAMVAQMATGLVAIHAAHVLHRDVKPSNAILTVGGVKMIDFGVSLPAMDEKTGPGDYAPPAGTLPYMAPECAGGEVDARIDTYALGVSLFEMVVGQLPLPQLGFHEWMNRFVRSERLPAGALYAIDGRIAELFERLTDPDRDARPYVAEIEPELRAMARAMDGVVPTAILIPNEPLPPLPPGPPPVPATQYIAAPPGAQPPLVPGPIAPTMVAGRAFRLSVAVPGPERIVIGWPHLPVIALVPEGAATRICCFDPGGRPGMAPAVLDDLRGGIVADLDGDGVGELYAWSETAIHVVDARGDVRARIAIPRRAGSEPWDDGAIAPVVLDGGGGAVGVRELAAGQVAIDGVTHEVRALAGGWQGKGPGLDDALGVTGLSCHGAARQRFRGDVGTPAAILARKRVPGFVVASLERVFDGHPTVMLGLWGPGGHRVGGGKVGAYSLQTAPWEMYEAAQQSAHAHFADHCAPLALLGTGAPEDDVIIVPFLHNAPWFGPVIVAFDGTGKELWRERITPPLSGDVAAPPLLVDLDGTRRPQLVWSDHTGAVYRRDARTGAELASPGAAHGTPVAALDLGGRGDIHLINWLPDAIEATLHGRCLPGATLWLPTRGDLWRSGTLGNDGFPVGPRV